ncbi:SA1362 family protein [Radiobacillus sp. PE A8.2]|uniref:SA1362 family protein n=1 Tax=Radiobacillus sp. PE A8.2 TaxID=3380349 RepID=UPI00389034CB
MFRNKLNPIILLLITLALVGLGTQLFTNTASLVTNLLIMVAVGALVYGIVYYFVIRKRTSNDIKKYKKAVKQSKMKYKLEKPAQKSYANAAKKQSPLFKKSGKSKANAPHLRVIEGNKQKRKKRAF